MRKILFKIRLYRLMASRIFSLLVSRVRGFIVK